MGPALRALGRWVLRSFGSWPVHLVAAALLLPRAVFLGEALYDRDLHQYFYPLHAGLVRTVLQGLPPVWDQFTGFGQPLLADPNNQAAYPPTWLYFLLPAWTAYTVIAVGHLAFSGVGFTRLARSAGLDRLSAAVAGLAWMLGGPYFSLVNLWHHHASASWMPWVVLAGHRLVRRPTLRSAAVLGGCLGLQVLAGSADMVLLTAGAFVAWIIARGAWPRWPAAVAWGGAALLLALALSAIQWMPALELASRGLRSALPAAQLTSWSIPPAGLLRLLVPLDASGRLAWGAATWSALFDDPSPPLLGSLYVGAVALALAGGALAAGPRRRCAALLAGAGGLAVLVALGRHTPVHGLLVALLPPARHLRYPSKVMVVAAFAVALLAGLGLAAVRAQPRARRVTALLAASLGLLLAAGGLFLGPGLRLALELGVLAQRDGVEGDVIPVVAGLFGHAVLALLASAALFQAPTRRRVVVVVVAACLGADLLLAHHDLHATTSPELLRFVPPVVSALGRSGQGRTYVVEYALLRGYSESRLGHAAPYAVAQPVGVDPRPLSALGLRLYPMGWTLGAWGVESSYDLDLSGLQPLPMRGLSLALRNLEGTPSHLRLLQIGAVSTVVSLHSSGFGDLVPGPSFPSLFAEPILTFRVPGTFPRARVVGRGRVLEGRPELEALLDPGFDPASEVLLAGEGAAAAARSAVGGSGSVRIEELRGDRVRLDVEADAAALVVLADAWDPGWRAWVDGRPADVLRANVAFRAVPVPAGRHTIEMRYRPTVVMVGLALTCLAILSLAVAAWRVRASGS